MGRRYDKELDDEIINLLAEGDVCNEIGAKLNRAYDTIRNRINQLKINNDCRTITHLVVKYLKLKTMDTYVVYDPVAKNYLQDEPGSVEVLTWGEPETAFEFSTLQAAESAATNIGGGTVGTTRPS